MMCTFLSTFFWLIDIYHAFSNTHNYDSSGVIYSTGWPNDYKAPSSACNYKIQKSNSYQGTRVTFMDINLYYYYYHYRDCMQLYGKLVKLH